ncbi:sulfite exporter TauE/SafE family protein [Streptomyces reniochalinae]|uniref:Probable membrane transporter protein n=1 Tax=Streptomyces reniochalinae TaxID=2250578 RepID=A0A367EG72_9ACTN|nr:sulfite exporter TauE/SafE family protein [Streptomyces reniochalinae]RCG16357.1 sulfite exporter TauE/SafE family protein [Streptomyces reniochalinae]
MTIWEAVAVCAAGIAAGGINTVVGSGTLITFPVLLAVGLPPVTANVSNTIGLVPGSVSGAIGYRRELRGQRSRVLRLGGVALLGGLTGAILLLTLPSSAFDMIVPVLIAVALVLVVFQPRLAAAVRRRRERKDSAGHPHGGIPLQSGILVASAYGGYFGAAQGVIYVALMGLLLNDDLQRINAVKNVLGAVVNGVAAVFFVFVADVDWTAVLLIALGSAAGGQLGARIGRKLAPGVLRGVIVAVGLVAIVQLVLD